MGKLNNIEYKKFFGSKKIKEIDGQKFTKEENVTIDTLEEMSNGRGEDE